MQSINYRLKQIDFDSNFEYSKTVTVSNEYYGIENMENVEWSLLPNPITNQFQIDAYFSSNNSLKITIKDLLGNDVYQTTKQVSNGNQIINIDNLDKLHAGCYILQIQYGSVYKQKLIMKQ
jgi:hypothetical protein